MQDLNNRRNYLMITFLKYSFNINSLQFRMVSIGSHTLKQNFAPKFEQLGCLLTGIWKWANITTAQQKTMECGGNLKSRFQLWSSYYMIQKNIQLLWLPVFVDIYIYIYRYLIYLVILKSPERIFCQTNVDIKNFVLISCTKWRRKQLFVNKTIKNCNGANLQNG